MRIERLFNKTESAAREIAISHAADLFLYQNPRTLTLQTCFCASAHGFSYCRLVLVFSPVGIFINPNPAVHAPQTIALRQ